MEPLRSNNQEYGCSAQGDFNYSGVTDIADFALLAANFNQEVARQAVHEPYTSAIALTVLPLIMRRSR